MLSNMFSPHKKYDTELLYELADAIELVAKHDINLAKSLGEHYLKLEHKIKTHDYQIEDEHQFRMEKYLSPHSTLPAHKESV